MEAFGSGSFIETFVSDCPKNYAFSFFCPSRGKRTTKCNVKCLTLNYEHSKVVNFTTLKDMILKDTNPGHVHNPKEIKRTHCVVVLSEPEKRNTKSSLRSADLWTILTPRPTGMINLF